MKPLDSAAAERQPSLVSGAGLEERISETGRELGEVLNATLDLLPEGRLGPQILARALSIDKVLASRLLKAARAGDPMAVAYHAPGPEPLRRFFRSARKRGVDAALAARAGAAVDAFESLIRRDIGDRSALDAMISAWLPEAREVFELRRKQSAFRAMSELKGMSADLNLGTVLLHPAKEDDRLDVVWVVGLLGVRRLRAGVTVKLTSRRMPGEDAARHPQTLDGRPIEDAAALDDLRLDAFCDRRPAPLEVRRAGDVNQYLLAGEDFGPRSAVDLILGEANFSEMSRVVPAGSGRRGYVFAEIGTPCKALQFDVLVHDEVYPGQSPRLDIYDTVLDGVASVNDPSRDIDRLDLSESFADLGRGTTTLRSPDAPHYLELVQHVFERTGWDAQAFRAFRCRAEYPVYGAQLVASFQPPEA